MSKFDASAWESIETAPMDEEILVFTRSWGAIIALHSSEYGEWMSRMQVPVALSREVELPTHWLRLPEPPPDGAGA